MRTGGTFNTTSSSSLVRVPRASWHSPVPYLFGGLAAMLGLIIFALLILACSYWKFSGLLENRENDNGDEKAGESIKQSSVSKEEKIAVIMAGEDKPTFLATPISVKPLSLGGDNNKNNNHNHQQQHHHQSDRLGKLEVVTRDHQVQLQQTEESRESLQTPN